MKNWNLLFRRTHLYLGMALLPWMALYGLSTVIFNHREHFGYIRAEDMKWELLWEKESTASVPTGQDALRDTAQKILTENQLSGPFGVQRQGQRLVINLPNFRAPTRVTLDPAQKKLRAERRTTSFAEKLMRMHERTGYGRGGLLHDVWAAIVDIFCVTTLAWIATGLYLWWKIAEVRRWGFLAIAGGAATIAILLRTV